MHIVNDHLIVRPHNGYFAPPAPPPSMVPSPAQAGSPFAVRAARELVLWEARDVGGSQAFRHVGVDRGPPACVSVQSPAAMLQQFQQVTGMNEPFSRQCLDENAWNFDAALQVYQQLKAQGQIPPAAYL